MCVHAWHTYHHALSNDGGLTPSAHAPCTHLQACYCFVHLVAERSHAFDIAVPTSSAGTQLLCAVVDNVEALVDEWFPGLRDLSIVDGAQLIHQVALCPVCPGQWVHVLLYVICGEVLGTCFYIVVCAGTVSVRVEVSISYPGWEGWRG